MYVLKQVVMARLLFLSRIAPLDLMLVPRYAGLGYAEVSGFTVLGWLYLLSYFKLFVTSTKYVPQVRL